MLLPLLLALHGDPLSAAAGLEQEDPLTGTTDRAHGERIDLVEVEEHAHRYTIRIAITAVRTDAARPTTRRSS